jgi:hypothetical protein
MYIHGLHINGFADLPIFRASALNRRVRVLGPSPAATAVGDGLALAFAALSEPGLQALLQRWGLTQPGEIADVETNPLPIQASWTDREMAQALVADRVLRRLQVQVSLLLDPPLFAKLGANGAREPRLVTALGDTPIIRWSVSAYIGASWDVLSLGLQSFSVGDASFPTSGQERAPWLTEFLLEIGQRFFCHNNSIDIESAAMTAMTSLDKAQHRGFLAWQTALKDEFGVVRPARGKNDSPVLLAADLPIRRFGRHGIDRSQMAASVFLSGADVLWAGHADSWVEDFVEGEHSALEQVWRTCPEGEIDPSLSDDAGRSVLAFSQGEE